MTSLIPNCNSHKNMLLWTLIAPVEGIIKERTRSERDKTGLEKNKKIGPCKEVAIRNTAYTSLEALIFQKQLCTF